MDEGSQVDLLSARKDCGVNYYLHLVVGPKKSVAPHYGTFLSSFLHVQVMVFADIQHLFVYGICHNI